MKLSEILNHDKGLEVSYLVGCYDRFRQCHLSHELQTLLCRYELYEKDLSFSESQDLLKALTLYNVIQSPRVYHFGKIGTDEFRRQRLIQNKEITDTFQLTPTIYHPDNCDEFKKKTVEQPFIQWDTLKIGVEILAITVISYPILKKILIFFPTSKNLFSSSLIKKVQTNVREIEKLAAGFLLYLMR